MSDHSPQTEASNNACAQGYLLAANCDALIAAAVANNVLQ
jgi:hypothetical protein